MINGPSDLSDNVNRTFWKFIGWNQAGSVSFGGLTNSRAVGSPSLG